MIKADFLFRVLSFFAPLFYVGHWGKKTAVYKVGKGNNLKIKLRVNTLDFIPLFEVWKLNEYQAGRFVIKPNDIVVDIGAHIGTFSIWAASKAFWGKVFSFEPDEENYLLLKDNIKINGLKNVKCIKSAISGRTGSIKLYKSSIFSVGHSFYGKDSLVAAKVPTLSLKKLFERYNLKKVDFMKIDTEGAEYDIILNTPKRVLKKINKMIIEYHDYLNHGHSWIELQEYLQKAGFKTELALSVFQRKLFGLGHIRAWRD